MSSRSKLGRLSVSAFGPGSDTTPGATRLLFAEWDHGCSTRLLDAGDVTGGHGSLDHILEHNVQNTRHARPNGRLRPAVGEWRHLLPWIFNHNATDSDGGSGQSYTFEPTDTALVRNVHFSTDAALRTYLAAGCVVGQAVLRSEAKAAVELDIQLEGRTYTEAVAFAGDLADATNYTPRFVHANQAVTLNSVATKCRSVVLGFTNVIANDRHFYGLDSAGPVLIDRLYTAELTIPFGLHQALLDDGITDAGVPLVVAYTAGSASMTFTYATVKADADSFRSVVPQEDFFTFRAMCLRKQSATATPAVSCALVIP